MKPFIRCQRGCHGHSNSNQSFHYNWAFSVAGKARAAMDFVLPKANRQKISLWGIFRRRVGDEVVENLIEPLLSGIYAGDIDRLSLMSTFPQFYQTEQKHRSLILGMKNHSSMQKRNK